MLKKTKEIAFFSKNEAKKCVDLLIQKNWHISFAESCTGGLLVSSVVGIADASKVLDASFVTYANESKIKYLGVNEKDIETFGVVSTVVAEQMAHGCALANNAEIGVATSGIAGPTGGTPDKPVGTVAFGFYINGKTESRLMHFADTGRQGIREAAVLFALNTVSDLLQQAN